MTNMAAEAKVTPIRTMTALIRRDVCDATVTGLLGSLVRVWRCASVHDNDTQCRAGTAGDKALRATSGALAVPWGDRWRQFRLTGGSRQAADQVGAGDDAQQVPLSIDDGEA